jgi:hypothetical protein
VTTRDVFLRIIAAFDAAGIPYMLTGSYASSFHGAPRASQDIDFVISATPESVARFVKALPESEYYVDLDAALDALRRESMFNVIDLSTGWKLDLIARKSRAFSREEFNRRVAVDLDGVRLFVASAEDTIVAKLEWAKLADSERQIEDVAGILRIRADLDHEYIERWARALGLDDQLAKARKRVGAVG